MASQTWQKSTFSPDGTNCVYLAATPDDTILLRESDTPDTILTTTPDRLRALLNVIKAERIRPT